MDIRIAAIAVTILLVIGAFAIFFTFWKKSECSVIGQTTWVQADINNLNLTIDACKIDKDENNQVIYDGVPTCVAWNTSSTATDLITPTYYSGPSGIFEEIQNAVNNGGIHPSCPS